MDKSDSRLHCEQIEKLMAAGRFKDAVFLADKVDWRKEEDNKRLIQAAEVYRKNRRFDDAINILKIAHNRKPNNKKIVFLICEIYFENKDVVTAQVYLDRYQSMTDRNDWHYDALKYKRALAYDLPVPEKIDILLDLKAKEPAAEQFRYELAVLYQQARQYAECGAECDELLLLFGDDGNFAKKALELKKGILPLSDEQETLLRKLTLDESVSDRLAKSTQNVKLMNTMDMSTLDLEKGLAEDIRTLKSEDSETKRRKKPEFNTKSLQQTIPPSTQEVFFADKTEDIQFTQEMNISNYSGYTVVPNGSGDIQEVRIPYSDEEDFDDETGMSTPDDLLADWNRRKARNTENMMKNIHKDVVETTGKIFEKKKEEEEADEEFYNSVTDTVPGSIWEEVESDEFAENTPSYTEDEAEDNAVAEENTADLTEDTFEEETVEEETVEAENEEDYVAIEGEVTVEEPEEIPAEENESDEFGIAEEETADEEGVEIASNEAAEVEVNAKDVYSYDVEPDEESADDSDEESIEASDEEGEIREEEQEDAGRVKELSPEERKLFAPFLYSKKMRAQIVNALENITLAAYTGNVIITTENNDSGFALAKSVVKFVKFADTNFAGAMSRIDAEKFNTKNVSEILDKLNNGALVIERANKLSNNSLIKLTQGIYQEERGIIIFLVDTKNEIKRLLNRQRTLADFFNIRIDIVAMNEDALVDYGTKYAASLGYSIEEGFANLAFHKRVREAQAGNHIVTTTEVKEIIDEAVERNDKNFFSKITRKMSKKYRDEEGRVLLCEKDFD